MISLTALTISFLLSAFVLIFIDIHIIKNGSVLRTAIIFFYLSNEGISILENAALIGRPIPEKLKDVLAHAKAQFNGNLSTSVHYYTDDSDTVYQAASHDSGCWHVGVNYGGRLFGTVN